MSWLYSRALVEEFSAATCSDGDVSAPSNTTPTPDQFYWPDKTTEHSRLSRFGMTCVPLTADRGAALLTWFLEGSRAKTSAQLGEVTDWTASAPGCGRKWLGSLAKFDPDSRSWKTAQCSLLGDLDEFSETWPRWGSMRTGECWERETPAHLTTGNESGLWPTPCARDYRGVFRTERGKERRIESKRGIPLNEAVGGLLNPPWVEWLMGWPIEWTGLKPLETGKFQEWKQQHGAF